MIEVPVLIVGAGPGGMSLALGLERFGVQSMLIDRQATTMDHPRARANNSRTMEIFRLWGLEQEFRALQPTTVRVEGILYCESVMGPTVARGHLVGPSSNTAAPACWVPQNHTEALLAKALATATHTEVRRGVSLVAYEYDENCVVARIRDVETEDEVEVRARYLVGFDGAGSRTRKILGVKMEGPSNVVCMNTYSYRAPVGHLPQIQGTISIDVVPADPDVPSGMLVGDLSDRDRWLFSQFSPAGAITTQPPVLSEQELQDVARIHWGIPDLEIEFESFQSFKVGAQIAEIWRQGPVLLGGDAAHAVISAGGFGLNSAIADAHNLAWKLAMVIQGLASADLLDTYTVERRPLEELCRSWAIHNMTVRREHLRRAWQSRNVDVPNFREALLDMDNWVRSEGLELGCIYQRGALIDDGSLVAPYDAMYYWHSDRPGARFPHVWIDIDRSESTIDWFDTAFVLVCGPDACEWERAAKAVAADTGIPLEVRVLSNMSGPFTFGPDEAVLVRPDGFVAWRPGTFIGDKTAALLDALGAVLAGGTEARR
jgi:2-polyprenyl-6-methoxyphenol hydroxylase-like FAD-dependent oxidoreductase